MKDLPGKLLALAMVGGLALFIMAQWGLCGEDVQEAVVGTVEDARDWGHHVRVHRHD